MKPVFFTDFDRTMIFSNRFADENIESTCVEYKEGRAMSFMTGNAIALLEEVKQSVIFIPVTTRTWELITRVNFINTDMPEWLVCSNGGRIYHNGERSQEWDAIMQQERENHPYSIQEIKTSLQTKLKKGSIKKMLIYENSYLMIKFKKIKPNIKKKLDKVNKSLLQKGYRIEISSNKAYIIPDFIRKERAVAYLIEKLKTDVTISAGDSIMDVGMLALTDYAIAPKHKTFEDDFMQITMNKGLAAGEEILHYVKHLSTTEIEEETKIVRQIYGDRLIEDGEALSGEELFNAALETVKKISKHCND